MPEEDFPIEKENILVEWSARTRPFKRYSREVYVQVISVAVLFGLILFLIEGIMPVLLIAAVVFLFYVFSTVEPDNVSYQMTSYGVRVGGDLKGWDEMGRYWFTTRTGHEILVMETFSAPWRMELVIDSKSRKKIEENVSKYLHKHENPITYIDKASSWVSGRLKL